MELKYKPLIGLIMLILGMANLGLSALTASTFGVLSGVLFTLIGVLMLSRSMVGLTPQSIAMRNLLGMTMKRHQLQPGNFEVRDNKIFVNGKKRVSLWMFDTDEQTVRNYLQGPT